MSEKDRDNIIWSSALVSVTKPLVVMNDHILTQVNKTKFLGVYIDENLTWKDHVPLVFVLTRGLGVQTPQHNLPLS